MGALKGILADILSQTLLSQPWGFSGMTFQKQSEGKTSSHRDFRTAREILKMEEKDGNYSD